LEQERESYVKKINETEINNNDLTVRSSRKELEAIELSRKVEILERDLSTQGQNYNHTINSLRQDLASLQHKHQELGNQLYEKNQELQNKLNLISKLEQDLKIQL
jgi:uncharacterized protein involved in exopolysaccharide biosynthesis